MIETELNPWLFTVVPHEGESLSHFLGRFRLCNQLTASGLGQLAGIGAVIARWERFHLNPYPTDSQIMALGATVSVDAKQLWSMLAPEGERMKCTPIRLCGACYEAVPCHRIEWQYQSKWRCDRHQLKLLAKCPNCEKKFPIPALWEAGCCDRCRLPFGDMVRFQKAAD